MNGSLETIPQILGVENKKIARAVASITAASLLYEAGKKTYQWGKGLLSYNITIEEKDHMYTEVHKWLMDILPEKQQKSLKLATVFSQKNGRTDQKLVSYYDGAREGTFFLDGNRIKVRIFSTKAELSERDFSISGRNNIIFTVYSKQTKDILLEKLVEINNRTKELTTNLYTASSSYYAEWAYTKVLPNRTLESVERKPGRRISS